MLYSTNSYNLGLCSVVVAISRMLLRLIQSYSQCVCHMTHPTEWPLTDIVSNVLCSTSASGCIVFCLNSKVDALLALYDNYQFSPRLFLSMYIKLVKRSQLQCKCVTTTYKSMKLFFSKVFFVQSDKIIPHFMGNCTASL